jgi:hypothetical protein
VVKGPLQVRPVFLHTDQRIEGLVFFTLVALLGRAILAARMRRAGLAYSVDQVLFEFAPLSAIVQPFVDGTQLGQLGGLSAVQQEILLALHLPAPEHYLPATEPTGWPSP